jgi:hypothetical protein
MDLWKIAVAGIVAGLVLTGLGLWMMNTAANSLGGF